MAKVTYPPTVTGIIGRVTTGVYYRAKSTVFGYLRSWAYPTITTNMHTKGSYLKNIQLLWNAINPLYIADLKAYGLLYENLPVYGDPYATRTKSCFAIWYKLLYAWSVAEAPAIDLATLTYEDLGTLGFPTALVDAIDAGYLPEVPGYKDLDAPWTMP